uniref:Uncharacterized protein n=1 Tax=Parascaris equorum TaxID=6256 RepID=A0A914S650_PAREQ
MEISDEVQKMPATFVLETIYSRIPIEKLTDLKHDISASRTEKEKKELGVDMRPLRTLSTMTIRKVHSRRRKGLNSQRRLSSEVVLGLDTTLAQSDVSAVSMSDEKERENAT